MASRRSHAPLDNEQIEYKLRGSDSNGSIGTRRNWCSAMGGCVATARRHSLLCLPRQLVNCSLIEIINEQNVQTVGGYGVSP